MSDSDEPRFGPLVFAWRKLFDATAEYEGPEIAIVLAIVGRGLAMQPNSEDESNFLSDDWISARTRICLRSIKQWISTHCGRKRPVLGRSWPGRTWGTDQKWHLHDCARYTLLRTEEQVAAAVRSEREHQATERERLEKRKRTAARRHVQQLREQFERRRRAK
jgi:hypothetical protein